MGKQRVGRLGCLLLVACLLPACVACGRDPLPGVSGAESDAVSTTATGTDAGAETTAGGTTATTATVTGASVAGSKSTVSAGTKTTAANTSSGKSTGTAKPSTTPKTTAPTAAAAKGATKLTDYIRDVGAWTMKGIRGYGAFTYQVQILGKQQYNRRLLELTINDRRLGDTGYSFGATVDTAEWPTRPECNYGRMPDGSEPANRAQALEGVRAYLASQIAGKTGPFASMDSFTRWQHYTAEAGYDYIGCELGANVNASNLSIAFTRGAAKQYSEKAGLGSVEAWFVDFSLWNWLGMINYSGDETMHRHNDGFHDNIVNHEYAGQSVDDARRAYYMAYMSGAQWLINEGGAESACYTTVDEDDTWLYDLSPHGEMNQEFYAFTQRNPDRGVTYTPFAVVINHDHGLP